MRRYKFKTADDAIELCRYLGENSGVMLLASYDNEAAKKTADSLQCMVLGGSYYGTFAMTFTIVELYLVCFTHKTIT